MPYRIISDRDTFQTRVAGNVSDEKKSNFLHKMMQGFRKSGFRVVRFMSKNGLGRAANAKKL